MIVGAGISGLSAARHLQKHASSQFDVIILEASHRIGGRVHTIHTDDGVPLEMGAQYIHGTVGNPLFDYALDKKLVLPLDHDEWKPSRTIDCFADDVADVPKSMLMKAIRLGNALFEECTVKLQSTNTDNLGDNISVWEGLQRLFSKALSDYDDKKLVELIKSVLLYNSNLLSGSEGSPSLHELDLKAMLSYKEPEGHTHFSGFTERGYSGVVEALVEDAPDAIIKFDYMVNKVKYNRSGVIELSCTNGETFEAQHVILTVSCNVLKAWISDDVFTPPLPKSKIAAVRSLTLSNVYKIHFKFKTPLPKDIRYYRFYPSADIFKNSSTLTSSTFGVSRIRASDWWLLWLQSGGPYKPKHMHDKTFVVSTLKNLSKIYPTFPGDQIDTDDIYLSKWTSNDLFKGCWSYVKTGVSTSEIEDSAKPLTFDEKSYTFRELKNDSEVPLLFFAGEATHLECYSTTQGAFLSGIREADNILKFYDLVPRVLNKDLD